MVRDPELKREAGTARKPAVEAAVATAESRSNRPGS